MLQVQAPYQQFFGLDGQPLNGSVYIGSANQNPETNPIAIYWDDAGTIPAAQPIVTMNGYAVRNGSPARIYTTAEDFSMTVRDNLGRLVFTIGDGTSMSSLQALLVGSGGSANVGFLQQGTGAVARTLQSKNRDLLCVFDFMTQAQIDDIRAGTFAQDVTTPMNTAAAAALVLKRGLFVPSGGYKMTAPWSVPPEVYVLGESLGMETAYDPGATWLFGAVIYKAHTGNGLTKQGASAYYSGAPIENISFSSNRTAFAGGAAIMLDKVSNCHLIRCNTFSMGGDSYILGVTAGDVTGHNYVFNCYSNNPVGVHYRCRQKWGRYHYPVGDGGQIGMYFDAASMSEIDGFHFEGFTQIGMKVSNGSTNVAFVGRGYIGATVAGAVTGIQVTNESGNSGIIIENVWLSGNGVAGGIGVQLYAAAISARVSGCTFNTWPVGISNSASYGTAITYILNNMFATCGLPIYTAGEHTRILNNDFEGTTGSYCIQHAAGTKGLWMGNNFDKPLLSGLGIPGNFNGICVKDNNGYKTRARGTTASIAPYANIPHGLAGAPESSSIGISTVSSGITSFPQIALADATNLQLYWTGSNPAQFNWQAACPCDF